MKVVIITGGIASSLSTKAGSTGVNLTTQKTNKLRVAVDTFIAAANSHDVEQVLALFTPDAVIDDPSTGHCFDGHAGIRNYIEQYFIGYHTVTRFLSMDSLSDNRADVRVDFTGDFGHEIGSLIMSVNTEGIFVRIDASLE